MGKLKAGLWPGFFICCTNRLTDAKQMWHIFRMRYTQLLIAALSIGVISQALAVDPPSPTSAPTAPVSLTATASTEDPAAAAEQAKAEAKAKAEAQAKADADAKAKATDKRLRAMGYKPMNTNGTMRYCRSEQQLGSRFERQVCGTPEELDFAEQQGKETVRQIQQNNASLPGGK
jgi:hypothetical protein